MESQEAPESTQKEGRGRQGKTIPITLNLSMSDHGILSTSQLRLMRRTGEDVTRERAVSEALQCLLKSFSSQE
ncbi:MAG: hypothetical protein HY403_06065 [Elusimicrobia bacterium]|nr:hypothetical protein [Elusimicrobiota bacterium]